MSRGQTQQETQLDALYMMHPTAMKYIKVQKPTLPFSLFQGHTLIRMHTHTKQELTWDETAYSMGS